MKRGDVVMVYEDPITEKRPVGKAQIIKIQSTDNDGIIVIRHCWVFFEDDDQPAFMRQIRDHDMERSNRSKRIRNRLASTGL